MTVPRLQAIIAGMDVTIETLEAQPIVGIRVQTKISEIGDKIGACMGELAPFVGDRCSGPPLARYHTWDGEGGEMEVALPVHEAIEGSGHLQPGELPGGRAAVVMHVGPYENLNRTWQALGTWIKEQGLEGGAPPWECYMNDPGANPPEKWLTKIIWPVP